MIIDETDMPGDDILSALKEDGRVIAPTAVRARVLSRLGVGVAAGAVAASHAAAASAAVGKAAGASAPVTGGVLGLGLVKALVAKPVVGAIVVLAVGSGVGLGTYQTLQANRAPVFATPGRSVPQAKPVEIPLQPKTAATARAVPEATAETIVPTPSVVVAPTPAWRARATR